jgi:hypothetical protein
LKHRFTDLTQVAFCADQKAENEFTGLPILLKHRFLELTQVSFQGAQIAENEFRKFRRPLETSLSPPYRSRILGRAGSRK